MVVAAQAQRRCRPARWPEHGTRVVGAGVGPGEGQVGRGRRRTPRGRRPGGGPCDGSNQTTLPSGSIAAPQATEQRATIVQAAAEGGQQVVGRRRCRRGSRTGGSWEPSATSTRGWLRVPRTRTHDRVAGVEQGVGDQLGDAQLGALEQVARGRVSSQADATQRRASCTERGSAPSVSGGCSAAPV